MRTRMASLWLLSQIAALASALGAEMRDSGAHRLGPDSQFHPDVPHGTVTQHAWTNSVVFPGTRRDYWVYVPAQYDPATPAQVMVFQDGGAYVKTNGDFRVPTVFDNLIAKRQIPP